MMLKQRIASGAPILGTFVKTPHPHVVEVLASSGLDCICLDAEHAPFDRRDLDLCIMAARAGSLATLVRTQSSTAHDILNALDCGADGIVVPHVRSADEARSIVARSHYGRGGGPTRRGYAGSSRAAEYGQRTIADHMRASAERTVIVAIAAVDGIDALFVGRIDLTVALGCTSPDDPLVIEAVKHVLSAAQKAGRPSGLFTPRPADVALWRDHGASLFLLGSDHGFLRSGAAQLRTQAGLD